MKIIVFTARYSITGVPLAQLKLARALARRGHEVNVIFGCADVKHCISDAIGLHVELWNYPKVRGMLWPLISYLLYNKPDVIFSAEDHLNSIVLLATIISGSKAKISCSSRVTPFDTYSNTIFTKKWLLKQMMRAVAWRANTLTCVSKDMVEQYKTIFKHSKHIDIYNLVYDADFQLKMNENVVHEWFSSKETKIIVAAGQLAPWKGFSDLIYAMKMLSKKRSVKLLILGDGTLRSELENLIIALGLEDTVTLYGYTLNPLKFFSKADVFALSSHVEGLPNVLVEAMTCGCTPVATDCPTGPRELLQNGKYGYLVPVRNPAALASAIEQALDNPIPKDILAEAVEPFKEDNVIKKHFDTLGLQ